MKRQKFESHQTTCPLSTLQEVEKWTAQRLLSALPPEHEEASLQKPCSQVWHYLCPKPPSRSPASARRRGRTLNEGRNERCEQVHASHADCSTYLRDLHRASDFTFSRTRRNMLGAEMRAS